MYGHNLEIKVFQIPCEFRTRIVCFVCDHTPTHPAHLVSWQGHPFFLPTDDIQTKKLDESHRTHQQEFFREKKTRFAPPGRDVRRF